ncbi:hypothetical protein VE03_10378 [Pseudogymnoascus sp. 23342-1-I1]|nr:hypothetical protein VE03_10378 [Pseudogymnoascus sp. 23342-1-I1]
MAPVTRARLGAAFPPTVRGSARVELSHRGERGTPKKAGGPLSSPWTVQNTVPTSKGSKHRTPSQRKGAMAISERHELRDGLRLCRMAYCRQRRANIQLLRGIPHDLARDPETQHQAERYTNPEARAGNPRPETSFDVTEATWATRISAALDPWLGP